jgi:hypothetical protein
MRKAGGDVSDDYETSAERELSDELDAVRAENEQLRAVADAARDFLVATPLALRERRDRLVAALAQLDEAGKATR